MHPFWLYMGDLKTVPPNPPTTTTTTRRTTPSSPWSVGFAADNKNIFSQFFFQISPSSAWKWRHCTTSIRTRAQHMFFWPYRAQGRRGEGKKEPFAAPLLPQKNEAEKKCSHNCSCTETLFSLDCGFIYITNITYHLNYGICKSAFRSQVLKQKVFPPIFERLNNCIQYKDATPFSLLCLPRCSLWDVRTVRHIQ